MLIAIFDVIRTRQHEKKQISELLGILTEIKSGNGKGRSEKGSGFGLSIVRQLTEKMNGNVAIESSIVAGTTFTCRSRDNSTPSE